MLELAKLWNGFHLDENGDVVGAIPTLMSTQPIIEKAGKQLKDNVEEYVMSELIKLDIDPKVLEKQIAEINLLKTRIEELEKTKRRYEEMLGSILVQEK